MQRLSITRIPINLYEKPILSDHKLSTENISQIQFIVSTAEQAQKATVAKKRAKTAADRQLEQLIEELLENPTGITANRILTIAECERLPPIIIRLRNRLKKDGKCTLERKGKNDSLIYYITKTQKGIK